MEGILSKLYFDPSSAGSFGGVRRLYKAASEQHNVTESQVRDFLRKQSTYQLHKDRRHRFQRNKIIALYPDFNWEADLMDMQSYSEDNDGYNWILVTIDQFTKFTSLRALKDKHPSSVCEALADIFAKEKRVPHRLRTDRGNEFQSKTNNKFYKDHDILFFTTTNQSVKAAIVERVIRTLKARMFRYFTSKGSHRYVDVLQQFADAYNSSPHRSIKMSPQEASTADPQVVFRNLYGGKSLQALIQKDEDPVAEKGDIVRLAYPKDTFDKSYFSTHTDQVAKVDHVINRPKPLYSLVDFRNKVIPQNFYKHEFQVLPEEPTYRIERVLRTRTRNGKKEYYVKWLNFPASENSWVEDIGDVR